MTDYNSDQAKELRRARLLKIKPKAAPMMLTESEFNREFVEYRFVALERIADLEEANNIMFCPACTKDVNSVMGKRRVLHMSYEADPLGNFPLIAVAKCQGCEWEEMIPVVKQELSQDEQIILRRFHNAQAYTQQNLRNSSGLLDANRWNADMLKTFKNGPSIISAGGGGKVEYTTPDTIRFGQAKADRVWAEMDKHLQERRDLEMAAKQLDMFEHVEAEHRNWQLGKAAHHAQMYGAQSMMNRYSQQAAAAMAQSIDKQLMDQMQNMTFTHDEVMIMKQEPAKAAKSAHRTLTDQIKILRDKFDKKDRK